MRRLVRMVNNDDRVDLLGTIKDHHRVRKLKNIFTTGVMNLIILEMYVKIQPL